MNLRTVGVALLAMLATVACGTTADPTDPSATLGDANTAMVLPVHSLSVEEGVPSGELEATLIIEDSCLMLQPDTSDALLAVWPLEARFDDGAVEFAGQRFVVGEDHVFGGGEVSPDAPALTDTDLPDSCTYTVIWLITE